MHFSQRINIPPSATLTINSLALKKKKAGERVYNLSAGEAFVDTSSHIEQAAFDALKKNKTFYTPVRGIAELRESSCKWMNKTYHTNFSIDETFVTGGGKFALYALCQALLDPEDEAIVIAPYWVSYPSMIRLAGGTPIILETKEENNWKISPEQIAAAVTEKTRFLILNNASNPTGVFYSKDEIKNILAVAKEKNILVISDEVYSELVYDDLTYASCSSFAEYKDNVIIVHSASKIFSMTGWRVGFVFARKDIIDVLAKIQGQSTSNTSSIGQWATVAAFEHAREIILDVQQTLEKRRNLFVETFNKLFAANISKPSAGLYCFISMKDFGVASNDSVGFCKEVLEHANVAMVPGAAFGAEGFVRCSFGVTETEIEEALQKLSSYLSTP